MKENDWRLSLGGAFIILYPKCFQIEDDSLLFDLSQFIFSHPVQSVSEATMIHFQSYSWGHCVVWSWFVRQMEVAFATLKFG